MKKLMLSLAACAAMAFGARAGDEGAVTYTWQGAEGGAWASSANWSAEPAEGAFGYPDGVNATMKFTGSATIDGEGGTYNVKDGSFAAGSTVVLSNMTLKGSPASGDFWGPGDCSSLVFDRTKVNIVSGSTRLAFKSDGTFEFRNGSSFSGQYIDLWLYSGCKLIVRDNGTSLKSNLRWGASRATDGHTNVIQVINSVFEVTTWAGQNGFNRYNLISIEQGGRILWDGGFEANAAFPIAIQLPAEGTTAATVPFYSAGNVTFAGNQLRIDATACTTAGTYPLVAVAANKTLTVTDGMLENAEITTAEGFVGKLLLSEDGKTINLMLIDTTVVTPPVLTFDELGVFSGTFVSVTYKMVSTGSFGNLASVYAIVRATGSEVAVTNLLEEVGETTSTATFDLGARDTEFAVSLIARNAQLTSEETPAKTIILPSATKIGDCSATSLDDGYLLVSGTLSSIGLGQTTVSIVYYCAGSEGEVTNVIMTAQEGDLNPDFQAVVPAGYGNVAYWQIVSVNGTGDETFTDATERTRTVASAAASTYTWTGSDDGTTWELQQNWDATVTEGANPWPRGTSADVKFVDVADATVKMDGAERETGKVTVEGGKLTIDQNQGDWRLAGGTKGLTVKNADLTIKGGRAGCDFMASGVTLTATEDGTISPVSLTFDQVAISTQPRPVVNTAGTPVQYWLKNGATAAFTGNDALGMPAGAVFRATGAGSKIYFSANPVRWARNVTSNWRWLAEDGGLIQGAAFFYIGSANDTRDVVLTAVNDGKLVVGGGNNRTYFCPGGIVVATTNNGEVAFGAANYSAASMDNRTSHSQFLVKNGKVTGNLNLGNGNVFDVTGDENGESTLGTITYGPSSESNRISSVGGRLVVSDLLTINGTGNEVLLKDGVAINSSFLNFKGADNRLILDNAVLTNKANFCGFDEITNAPGCAVVFCGETPHLYVAHDNRGVCAELGSDTEQTDPVTLVFEPKGNGFAKAPLDVTYKDALMRPYLPLRVDNTKGYRRMSRYNMPLIAGSRWRGEKPTAEEIESHLPAGALPADAHLVWVDDTLCVSMPPANGFILMVR